MTTGGNFYNRLGGKRIINAASWITVYGGSIMPPAVVQAMDDASHWFVDMHEPVSYTHLTLPTICSV